MAQQRQAKQNQTDKRQAKPDDSFRHDSKTDPKDAGRNRGVSEIRCVLELGSHTGFGCGDRTRGPGDGESGWSSVLAVRTGRLRRSLAVHFRPIDLVVFQEPSDPKWVMETSS